MEITVRCPSGREPDVSVRCPSDWRVSELKRHLADVYPGRPAAEDQRIVFGGRLLSNEETLETAFGGSSGADGSPRVVHLVLPGGGATVRGSASAPAMTHQFHHQDPSQQQQQQASDELAALWREYSQYVHAHYLGRLQSPVSPSASISAPGASAAAGQQQQQQQPRQPPIAPDPAADAENGAEIGADGAVAGGGGGGAGGGLRDWFHTAVRCALMSLIIFYYSSTGKALSAFAIFFVMQAVQGGFFHRLRRAFLPAAPAPAPQPPPQAEAAVAPVEASPLIQRQQLQQQQQEEQADQQQQQQQQQERVSFTATLAAFLDALLTTLVAFFTSLIPDRPPPLANQ